ncbi:nucleolar-like protein [Rhynchospora pubera]|uniref:Nucleolar protein 16 n=1 Tax=Rhynchospora pubera TaxID=906938 RepID=A0AAV8EXY4_9POAL|nr:nucleolar-like protein [Rhynchospora pubera]
MGGSRRKYKKSRTKVRVGLPKKKPGVFKPAVDIPSAALRLLAAGESAVWDDEGSVIQNYKSFGVVSNPNLLGVRARTTPNLVQIDSLQLQVAHPVVRVSEFDPVDTGSDLEDDDLKSALGKKRRDGQTMPLLPLTKMQRVHVGTLIDKYGDNYQAMFMDTKLNAMQHSVATLKKLCQRYYVTDGKHFISTSKIF